MSSDIRDLLVELRHTAHAALRRGPYIDPVDWRTNSELNLLRVYALLVVLAGRLILATPLAAPVSAKAAATRRRVPRSPQLLNKVLRLLESFAVIAANEALTATSRSLGKAVISFVDKALGGDPFNPEGAYLGPMWESPVPPSIDVLVSEMAKPSTVSRRDASLASAKGLEASLLADANYGIASTVQLAQTFDAYSRPSQETKDGKGYRNAALVRVLAGHRLLLELLGVPTRDTVMAMLGLAQDISLSKTLAAFFTDDPCDSRYLASVRRRAATALTDSGTLSESGKQPAEILQVARRHESLVVKAVVATLETEG